MKIKHTKIEQSKRLEELSLQNGVDYSSVKRLLESVKVKKLQKRNNYHQETINDVIEKAIK